MFVGTKEVISKKIGSYFEKDSQEKYMGILVKEYVNFLNDDTKLVSEKFWKVEKRIKEDKCHLGVIMEMSKSEATWDILKSR